MKVHHISKPLRQLKDDWLAVCGITDDDFNIIWLNVERLYHNITCVTCLASIGRDPIDTRTIEEKWASLPD